MKTKKAKFNNSYKIDTIQNKKIHKRPKPNKKLPITLKKTTEPVSNNHLFDYLDQKKKESNILPLSGPNLQQNFVPCSFYAKGKCRYGTNCRFSHNFVEKMPIEESKDSIINTSDAFSFKKTHSLHLNHQLIITNVKAFTVAYKDNRTKTFLAVVHGNTKILIYSFHHPSALCSFEFSALEQVINFDFFSQSSDIYKNKSIKQVPYECNAYMLTTHMNNKMRLFNVFKHKCMKTYTALTENIGASRNHIYKVNNVNILKDLMVRQSKNMPAQVKAQLLKLKNISVWMIVQQMGYIVFVDAIKGVSLSSVHIGVQIRDIAFTSSLEASSKTYMPNKPTNSDVVYIKDRHLEKMPSYAAVAGKGISIWDFTKQKSARTLSYNSYTHYLALAGFEVKELTGGVRSLIVAIGKLQDSIISFGHEVFIEVWNPQTGGCIKRITATGLSFRNDLHDGLKYSFLSIRPVKNEDENDERMRAVCLANAGSQVEAWDLLSDKKMAELKFEGGHDILVESFVVKDEGKFVVIDRDLYSNCFEVYQSG